MSISAGLSQNLLVVDNDHTQLQKLRDIFTAEGFQVYGCANIEEATERCSGHAFAAAVLDFRLRGHDGIELLRQLRQSQPRMRTIIYTADGTFESAKNAVNLGAFAYVEKCGDPGELVSQVHRAVKAFLSEALSQSEERFRTIFEQAAVGVALIETKSGRFFKVNDKCSRLVGFLPDEMCQLTFADITHPEDAAEDLANMRKLLAGEISEFAIEKRLVRKDGSPLWVNVNVSPTWLPGAEPHFHIAIVESITARKAAEAQLDARRRQQAAVAQLGLLALQGTPIDVLTNRAADVVAETLGVEYSQILELSSANSQPLLQSGVGWQSGLVARADVPTDPNSQAGYTLNSKEPVVVESLPDDTRFASPRLLIDHEVVSGISVVIHGTAAPFGVLGVHTRQQRTFSNEEVDFVQAVANVLADAIHRHHQELQLRQTRDELRKSEAKYRTIVETTQEWIWEIDQHGTYTYSNPAVESLLGYGVDEVVGGTAADLLDEQDREFVTQELPKLVSETRGWTGRILRWRRHDGSQRHLESNAVPILDSEGQLRGYRGADRDITDRLRAEEAVRNNERSLARAQQIAQMGSWEYDLATGQSKGSAELFRMLGLPEDTAPLALESFIGEFVHPDDAEAVASSFRSAFSSGVAEPLEFRFYSTDRRECFVRAEAEVVADGNGTPHKIIGTLQDITARKRAELALRESEDKFRQLTERSPTIVAVVRHDRFVYCNPTLSAITGFSNDELLQMRVQDVIDPEYRALLTDRHRRRLAGEDVLQRYEGKIVTKNGENRWLDMSAQRIEADGAPAVLVTCVNVTERKQAEEALKQSEDNLRELNASLEQRVKERTIELAETNAELSAFARTVSHDLRAPLRAMEGFAAALAEDFGEQLGRVGHEYVQHIVDSAKRMDCLVSDLLEYSRLGRTELSAKTIDLNSVVNEARRGLDADIEACRATLDVAEELPSVLGHKATLVRVVTNLVSNSLKFVAEGVRPQVRIWAEPSEEGRVRLWVEDNGIGVDADHRNRVFRVFERLHGIESYPGTGIGLAIVARACERLDGRYGLVSRAGRGSRFWVEFPQAQESNTR